MTTAPLPPKHSLLAGAALTIALAAVLGGCGSSDDNTTAGREDAQATATTKTPPLQAAGAKLKLSADQSGGLSFDQTQLSAASGAVTLVMDNPKTTGEQHAIAVEGNGVDKDGPTVGPGQTSTVTAPLKPGKYTFYCPVPGHEAAGMKGTLTIT
jgi:uncharacterized cupredoxin-like copper-binding protein